VQFTSEEWIEPLKAAGVRISMDGKGRWIDNVFIERLWRSVKYEEVHLRVGERSADRPSGSRCKGDNYPDTGGRNELLTFNQVGVIQVPPRLAFGSGFGTHWVR
jgi:transposase InsO family protein